MKLSRLLEIQINRLFVISAALGVIVLLLSTAISTIEIKNKAIGFIASHVTKISMAEINSQNVSEIDREVRRLYEAWRATQDVDIRTEIFLDGKLVGKAGQLKRFGLLSYETKKTYDLPSGQHLEVDVDLDLATQIEFDLLLIGAFGIFIAASFALLKRTLTQTIQNVSKPLEDRVNWLTETAHHLPDSIKDEPKFQESSIDELHALDESLKIFTSQILALEDRVSKASYNEGRLKMADLLAHSIKGTIGLLRLRINNAKDLKPEDRERLTSAVNDVANAAKNLLKSRKQDESQTLSGRALVAIDEVLEKVVAQKIEFLPADQKISITFKKETVVNPVVHGDESELKAAFASILDNAVEAISGHGEIHARLKTDEKGIHIQVTDTGHGIPEDILPKLMQEGATFGKRDGNGLGLFHVKKVVDGLGGTVRLSSQIGKGTEVSIQIPRAASVAKADVEIPLDPYQTLVVLDDDPCIHETVNVLLNRKEPRSVVHLYSIPEFEKWMAENGPGELGSRVYWMDYDLKHSHLTGMSMIQKYGLQFESYLITGVAGDAHIQAEAAASNIRLHSKDDLANVKFKLIPTLEMSQAMVLEA